MSDEAFEQFLKSQQGESVPFFVMVTIREKMGGIVNLYKATLEALEKESKDSNYRKKLEHYANELMDWAELSMNQFDNLIMDAVGDEEGDPDDK